MPAAALGSKASFVSIGNDLGGSATASALCAQTTRRRYGSRTLQARAAQQNEALASLDMPALQPSPPDEAKSGRPPPSPEDQDKEASRKYRRTVGMAAECVITSRSLRFSKQWVSSDSLRCCRGGSVGMPPGQSALCCVRALVRKAPHMRIFGIHRCSTSSGGGNTVAPAATAATLWASGGALFTRTGSIACSFDTWQLRQCIVTRLLGSAKRLLSTDSLLTAIAGHASCAGWRARCGSWPSCPQQSVPTNHCG